jgi:hypothetical protein
MATQHTDTTTPKYIVDWVGDIVAIEGHIEEALDHQLDLKPGNAEVASLIQHLHDTVRDSKKRAVAYQESLGETAGEGLVQKGAEVLGKAAGLIDKMRKDTPTKALRDDYVAFNLAAISYTLLHTTSMALADKRTEEFAAQGLATYATLIGKVNNTLPRAALDDLIANKDVTVVHPDIAEQCRTTIDQIWKDSMKSA